MPNGRGRCAARRLLPLLGLLWLALPAHPPTAIADPSAQATLCGTEREARLRELTRERLDFYGQRFDTIQFATLRGGAEWAEAIAALELLLGYQPQVLDYEHPPELAQDLLDVSVARIAILLQEQLPCATLFRAGEQALAKRPEVCVLTLSPCAVAATEQLATGYLLNLAPAWTTLIPIERHLQAEHFLQFIIDHEVFHCLDSHYYGGMPRGYDSHWGEYWRTRNEMAADAFAIAMHRQRHGDSSGFVANLARLRGLSLQLGDPQHFTYDAIARVRDMPADELAGMAPRELVAMARRIGGELLPDYPAFLRYWASTYRAMQMLDVEPAEEENVAPPEGTEVDEALLEHLVTVSRRLDRELFAR